jgi:hypothetical protein
MDGVSSWQNGRSKLCSLGKCLALGAVYTCDFPYEFPYDSVYDLLSNKLIFDFFLLKCANKPLQWLTENKNNWLPFLFAYKIVHGILRLFVRIFVHVVTCSLALDPLTRSNKLQLSQQFNLF